MSNTVIKDFDKYTVPITRFNKGEANKIFAELKQIGTKVVVKNNKREAVIMSPDNYDRLMELLEDELLYEEAVIRINESSNYTKMQDFMNEQRITLDMLNDVEEPEFE